MRGRVDVGALVAGLVLVALGSLLALCALDVLDVGFGWMLPAFAAAAGAILLGAGLTDGPP